MKETKLEGVIIVEADVYGDGRGFFTESYNESLWHQLGLKHRFVQDNHSLSEKAGTLRGLHYQLNPKAQAKLVRVISGAVYDVALDIRKSSPDYGKWVGVILSASNQRQLLIPRGFAHGFCTLVPNTEVLYKVDALYSPQHDRGIAWDDPELGIDWPYTKPHLSDKDSKLLCLINAENNFQ